MGGVNLLQVLQWLHEYEQLLLVTQSIRSLGLSALSLKVLKQSFSLPKSLFQVTVSAISVISMR